MKQTKKNTGTSDQNSVSTFHRESEMNIHIPDNGLGFNDISANQVNYTNNNHNQNEGDVSNTSKKDNIIKSNDNNSEYLNNQTNKNKD